MKIITTEAQRHRENDKGKDPRTSSIIGAAIEVHRHLGPGIANARHNSNGFMNDFVSLCVSAPLW